MNARRWLLATAAASSLGWIDPARALDFRLSPLVFSEDGFTRQRMAFQYKDGISMMTDLPPQWNVAGESDALTMVAANDSDGTIRIEKSPLTPGTDFHDKGLDVYRRRFLSFVPKGAVNVRIVQERANPLPVFHWTDYEFVAEYEFYGRAFKRSAMFINLDVKEQILMTAFADGGKFDRCHDVGFDVLRSWTPVSASQQ